VTIVVDTSVLIDRLRGDARATGCLSAAVEAGERLVGSVLTRVEVLAGMRTDEAEATSRLLDALDWVDVDRASADEAGRLAQRFLRSHPGVDPVDYVIAATVRRVDGQLWTGNVGYFPMFAGLAPPY